MYKIKKMTIKKQIVCQRKKIIFALLFFGFFAFGFAQIPTSNAQQASTVNYDGQDPIDTDLDGLTNQGETQIYNTSPDKEDSDDDGYTDAVEVLNNSNPSDGESDPLSVLNSLSNLKDETSWPWYISRASGLVAFLLLYVSIFLALTLRVPFLRKYFEPMYALNAHGWIALQATVIALVHGLVLIFDKFLGFSVFDVLIPFKSNYETSMVTLGILSFYLMAILVATSYGRKYMSQKFWRVVHFSNIILYVIVVIHAFYLGTDMKNDIVRNVFILANAFLVLIMLINMFLRIKEKIARRNANIA
jgi:DMSO/TMAO reductase YedYZ heme-binding membrane subunit